MRVDDDVVHVVSGRLLECAAAGDQPQARVAELAVYGFARERRLWSVLQAVYGEGGGLAVSERDVDLVALVQVLQVEEDRGSGDGVDVAEDDGGAALARRRAVLVPAEQVVVVQRWHLDGAAGVQSDLHHRRAHPDGR